ncbi:MAG: type II toxin-antitoxin system HigB family toxin [Bryobacteraceae bacterium]
MAKRDNQSGRITICFSVLMAARRHGDSLAPATRWLTVMTAAECSSLMDVRRFYPSTDQVGKTLVFNIGGNNYRLLCCVSWELRRLFFRALLTHAEYDRVNLEALCP